MREFFINISNGHITNRKVVAIQFDLPDGSYLVTIRSKKNRSIPQNAYYWAAVLPLIKSGLNDAGYSEVKTINDAHEVVKGLFLKKYITNQEGTALEISGSTANLSTVEFNELIEKVQQWAAEFLGIEIPDPNEQIILFE
jgi:hypothetical protein